MGYNRDPIDHGIIIIVNYVLHCDIQNMLPGAWLVSAQQADTGKMQKKTDHAIACDCIKEQKIYRVTSRITTFCVKNTLRCSRPLDSIQEAGIGVKR